MVNEKPANWGPCGTFLPAVPPGMDVSYREIMEELDTDWGPESKEAPEGEPTGACVPCIPRVSQG